MGGNIWYVMWIIEFFWKVLEGRYLYVFFVY